MDLIKQIPEIDLKASPAAESYYKALAFSCPTDPYRHKDDPATLVVVEQDPASARIHALVAELYNMLKPRAEVRESRTLFDYLCVPLLINRLQVYGDGGRETQLSTS